MNRDLTEKEIAEMTRIENYVKRTHEFAAILKKEGWPMCAAECRRAANAMTATLELEVRGKRRPDAVLGFASEPPATIHKV